MPPINKRKHELYELHINEQEAEIVRLIFDKYVYEGYGAQRIATYLNNAGYRARSGKCWHPGSLRGMVGNLTYMRRKLRSARTICKPFKQNATRPKKTCSP